MKKLLVIMLLFPLFVYAQKRPETGIYETFCVDLDTLETTLNEFKEVPLMRGQSHRDPIGAVPLVIFVNPSTGSWTITERVDRGTYCVVALGNGFQPVPTEIRKQLEDSRKGKSM